MAIIFVWKKNNTNAYGLVSGRLFYCVRISVFNVSLWYTYIYVQYKIRTKKKLHYPTHSIIDVKFSSLHFLFASDHILMGILTNRKWAKKKFWLCFFTWMFNTCYVMLRLQNLYSCMWNFIETSLFVRKAIIQAMSTAHVFSCFSSFFRREKESERERDKNAYSRTHIFSKSDACMLCQKHWINRLHVYLIKIPFFYEIYNTKNCRI